MSRSSSSYSNFLETITAMHHRYQAEITHPGTKRPLSAGVIPRHHPPSWMVPPSEDEPPRLPFTLYAPYTQPLPVPSYVSLEVAVAQILLEPQFAYPSRACSWGLASAWSRENALRTSLDGCDTSHSPLGVSVTSLPPQTRFSDAAMSEMVATGDAHEGLGSALASRDCQLFPETCPCDSRCQSLVSVAETVRLETASVTPTVPLSTRMLFSTTPEDSGSPISLNASTLPSTVFSKWGPISLPLISRGQRFYTPVKHRRWRNRVKRLFGYAWEKPSEQDELLAYSCIIYTAPSLTTGGNPGAAPATVVNASAITASATASTLASAYTPLTASSLTSASTLTTTPTSSRFSIPQSASPTTIKTPSAQPQGQSQQAKASRQWPFATSATHPFLVEGAPSTTKRSLKRFAESAVCAQWTRRCRPRTEKYDALISVSAQPAEKDMRNESAECLHAQLNGDHDQVQVTLDGAAPTTPLERGKGYQPSSGEIASMSCPSLPKTTKRRHCSTPHASRGLKSGLPSMPWSPLSPLSVWASVANDGLFTDKVEPLMVIKRTPLSNPGQRARVNRKWSRQTRHSDWRASKSKAESIPADDPFLDIVAYIDASITAPGSLPRLDFSRVPLPQSQALPHSPPPPHPPRGLSFGFSLSW